MLFECLTALFSLKNISSNNNPNRQLLLLITLSLFPATTYANIQLLSIFTNGIDLRRNMPVAIDVGEWNGFSCTE